jgi:threonyl-tRNA synthetase
MPPKTNARGRGLIHRAILRSFEQMDAILLEHYSGKWPLWLSPCQAIVCPVSYSLPEDMKEVLKYPKEVRDKMHRAGFDVDIDKTGNSMDKMVMDAHKARYNYILVVGRKEAKYAEVSIRVRDKAQA